MSTTAQQRRGRGGSTVDFPPSEYQLTELKSVSASRGSSQTTSDFNIRLVQAVRDHPCFYDSTDSNYGSRHQAAQYRSRVWQEISSSIGFTGGAKALTEQWRKLKEQYTKARRDGVAEDPMDESLIAEMAWLDGYELDGMPATSAPAARTPDQMYFMEGEEDVLGHDFVDQHEYQEENSLEDVRRRGGSPTGSAHSGTGSDIDVGGSLPQSSSSHPLAIKEESRGENVIRIGSHGMMSVRGGALQSPRQPGGAHGAQSYRFVNSASSHQQQHHSEGIPVSTRGGSGTLLAYPKREGAGVVGGSTLTMVIDPTTYYQNGAQKMYRLVKVADLDHSQQTHQQLRPAGGGATLIAEPAGGGIGIGRGTRKRMGGHLSPPPMHSGGRTMMGGPSFSQEDKLSYGKETGQLGDDLILDDGIVGENTIEIDHQNDDDSPLLVDSPGLHHHHLMMGGGGTSQRMHRSQHSPTLLGNGSGARGYSPGLSQETTFSTSQYDADLALQHFISGHLARMNEDDKALAKMNIQRILLDARFGAGTTLRVCSCEEEAELTDAAIASEMVSGE